MRPITVAVVVNWNTRDRLRECLETLGACSPGSLAVVCIDNGSSDGSSEMVERSFPAVRLVRNRKNLGFARAANQGIRLAIEAHDPSFIALINSDALVAPTVLGAMVGAMRRDPSIAAAAPALRYPDGRLQAGAAGYRPTAWKGLCQFLFLTWLSRGLLPGLMIRQQWYRKRSDPVVVDWVSGACAVIRKTVLDRYGLLDERFFMYGEDVDWCCRVSAHGGRILYMPGLQASHVQGASMARINGDWLAALVDLVRRERGPLEAAVFRMSAAVGLGLRALVYGMVAAVSRDAFHARRARLLAVATVTALTPVWLRASRPPSGVSDVPTPGETRARSMETTVAPGPRLSEQWSPPRN